MKVFTNTRLLIIAVAIMSLLYTCKKDKTLQSSLVGTWVFSRGYDKSQAFHQTFQFNSDSTVQVIRTITDSTSGKLLGYQYLSNGKFRLNGTTLTLYNLTTVNYTGSSPYYTSLDKLTPYPNDTLETYTVNISADNNSFYFVYPPCPPNANCAGIMVYKRQ